MSAMASQITSVSIACSIVGSGADQRKHQSSVNMVISKPGLAARHWTCWWLPQTNRSCHVEIRSCSPNEVTYPWSISHQNPCMAERSVCIHESLAAQSSDKIITSFHHTAPGVINLCENIHWESTWIFRYQHEYFQNSWWYSVSSEALHYRCCNEATVSHPL